jgi:hypothetical protein
VGEPCVGDLPPVEAGDACAAGAFCPTEKGHCWALCGGPEGPEACPAGESCLVFNDGVLPLCTPTCDPLVQDCVDATCVRDWAEPAGFSCLPSWSGAVGPASPCVSDLECQSGALCMPAERFDVCAGTSCCAIVCDLFAMQPDVACSTAGVSPHCLQVSYPPAPGYEHVGVCVAK